MSSDLTTQLIAEAVRYAPKETGGVLLGDVGESPRVSIATELVGAGPSAQREAHRFVPDGPWQRAEIATRYAASGQTLDYLGDWHSHPSGNGPSRLDHTTARRIATTPDARCPHPLFLIVTAVGSGWELRPYRFGRHRLQRIALEAT